jgi:hypothetical protein
VISGGGFGEAKLVDLDRHRIDKERVEDYDYMSDSDLDSDDEAIEDNGYVECVLSRIFIPHSDAGYIFSADLSPRIPQILRLLLENQATSLFPHPAPQVPLAGWVERLHSMVLHSKREFSLSA